MLIVAGLCLRGVLRASQQAIDPRVAALIAKADASSLAMHYDEALARIDEAIALAEVQGDRLGLAGAYQMKGKVYRRHGMARGALPFLERALKEYEALGNKPGIASTLASLTAAQAELGDMTKARDFANRARQLFEELGEDVSAAWLDVSLASASPDYELTDERRRAIEVVARKAHNDDLLSTVFLSNANRAFSRAEYSSAVASYESAIDLMQNLPDVSALASAYVGLGRVFRAQGDYEGALARYQKAIDILALTGERYAIVEATNAAAIALGHLNRQAESIAMYQRGLALARESGNQRLIDFMEGNLAGGYLAAEEWERAIPALEAVIAKKPDPQILAYRQNSLAFSLAMTGRAQEALPLAEQAVQYSRANNLTDVLPDRLDTRSFVLKELGRYDEAMTDVRDSIGLLAQARTRVMPADYIKRGYAERVQYIYRHGVDILFVAGRHAEALEFAEQGRARAFLDLLAARESPAASSLATRGPSTSGLSSDTLGTPADLNGMTQIADRLKSTILEYAVTENATLIWVVRPGGAPVSAVRVPVGSKKLAELVASTTAALRESSTDAATARGEPAAATASDLLALPMRGLGLMALSRDDKRAWQVLGSLLIEPVRAYLPARGARLTIVPQGPLFQLSFAALRSGGGRYLIEDYELHYAPSASVLEFTGRRELEAARNTGPWAIVGNPEVLPLVGTRPLARLPGAAREISAIAAIAPKGSVLRLDGTGADEAALARALETAHPSVLHFATHGFVFDDPNTAPFLALNRRGPGAAEDGRLTLDEVYGLRLSADLVVLSACRSGSGQISSDGVIGLTRGFFYAGAPSVLATFWDVVDEATATLMKDFYREYVRTHAKAASLHAAQLALLNDLRAGRISVTVGGRTVKLPEHPLLWAAFFLSGEP